MRQWPGETVQTLPVSRVSFDRVSDSASDRHHRKRSQASVTWPMTASSRASTMTPAPIKRPLLPPTRDDHYNLRKHQHNLQLPAKTSTLSDNGLIKRLLYKKHWLRPIFLNRSQ